jgi:PII-like signaling protein
MLFKSAAKKVTIYVNEDTQYHHGSLVDAILRFLLQKGVAGATASHALAGFGSHHVIHTTKIEVLTDHLPVRIEFIEAAEKVEDLLPELHEMVSDGLIEVQDTIVVRAASREPAAPPKRPRERKQGPARLLRVFLSESDKCDGEPLYQAMLNRLRAMDITGATVYRGILGFGATGRTHKDSFLHLTHDLPVMLAVADSPEMIARASAAIEEMLQDGLIVVSDVDMIRITARE